MAALRFGEAPKLKFTRQEYEKFVRSTHLCGKTDVAEKLLQAHQKNPYPDVDTLIGDLQLILTESFNEFRQVNNTRQNLQKISVEELCGVPNEAVTTH
jgi:hypothetical protein